MRFSLLLITVLTLSASYTKAQELPVLESEGRKRVEETVSALPEYVIEVQRPEGCLVAPISTKHKQGHLLYALPRPAKVPTDNSVASKVFVWAQRKDGMWSVRVTIGTGEFYDAGDTKVAEYPLNTNERVMVQDFNRFGLAPIRVRVARIIRRNVGSPNLNIETQSVSVESIDIGDLPDPYKVRLRNNSNNDLIAIQYNKFRRNRFVELKWLSAGLINPLIKAGQTYELKVSSEDNSCGDDEGYQPSQSDRIDLVGAVFADGTIEGQSGLGTLIKGAALGNRRNLERVVETLRLVGNDPAELANELNNLHKSMDEAADPYLPDLLRTLLPPLPGDATPAMISFIRSGMHDVKVNLGRDANHFQILARRNNVELNRQWAERTRTKYERWLEAAQRITSQ
jgi:hypothetical protein